MCRVPYAVCRMPYAVCRMQHAVCSMPYAVCLSVLYAVDEMQMVLLTNIRSISQPALAAGAIWVSFEGVLSAVQGGWIRKQIDLFHLAYLRVSPCISDVSRWKQVDKYVEVITLAK